MDGAIYFNKEDMNLSKLINEIDTISKEEIKLLGNKAKQRIDQEYSWKKIINNYEILFKS